MYKRQTDDHTWLYLPQHRAVCTGDLFIWASPNCGNPQKVQRYPLDQARALLEEYRRTRPDLTDDQLKKFPYKNVVTRALGMKTDVCVELHRHELRPGDTLLLCCDGLTGMLSDDRIARIVRATLSLDDAAQALVSAANEAGGLDNITVVLARPSLRN